MNSFHFIHSCSAVTAVAAVVVIIVAVCLFFFHFYSFHSYICTGTNVLNVAGQMSPLSHMIVFKVLSSLAE